MCMPLRSYADVMTFRGLSQLSVTWVGASPRYLRSEKIKIQKSRVWISLYPGA